MPVRLVSELDMLDTFVRLFAIYTDLTARLFTTSTFRTTHEMKHVAGRSDSFYDDG